MKISINVCWTTTNNHWPYLTIMKNNIIIWHNITVIINQHSLTFTSYWPFFTTIFPWVSAGITHPTTGRSTFRRPCAPQKSVVQTFAGQTELILGSGSSWVLTKKKNPPFFLKGSVDEFSWDFMNFDLFWRFKSSDLGHSESGGKYG